MCESLANPFGPNGRAALKPDETRLTTVRTLPVNVGMPASGCERISTRATVPRLAPSCDRPGLPKAWAFAIKMGQIGKADCVDARSNGLRRFEE